MSKKVNFGFEEVNLDEKQNLVSSVFSSVAGNYDIMNDLMSLGIHRLWKRDFVADITIPNNAKILDLAAGSGDISKKLINKATDEGKSITIYITDVNEDMLAEGKARYYNENWGANSNANINFKIVDATEIDFEDNFFDLATISFGIRNVPDIPLALQEINRVLKPKGKFHCLEFSNVDNELFAKIYDKYSFNIIPKIGGLIAKDADSYKYLVESIKMFPKDSEFKSMIESAGFKDTGFTKLTKGICAMHWGQKI